MRKCYSKDDRILSGDRKAKEETTKGFNKIQTEPLFLTLDEEYDEETYISYISDYRYVPQEVRRLVLQARHK